MKHWKRTTSILVMLTLVVTLIVGCGGSKAPSSTGTGSDQKIKIKLGHVVETNHAYHLAAQKFADLVKEKTKGQVEVTVFPSSQLGGERQELEALQAGTLEMTLCSTTVKSGFVPEWGVFDLPYLFDSYNQVFKVTDTTPVGKQLTDLTIQKGIRPLYYVIGGARSVYTNKKPIKSLEDLKGLKIRVIESPSFLATFKALGANPVPMAFAEVFSALEQKVVDAGDNSLQTYFASKHYEVAKNLTITNHNFLLTSFDIGEKFYQSLPKDVQKAINESAKEAGDYERKLFEQMDQEALDKAVKGGAVVTKISDFTPFKQAVKPMWADFSKKIPKGEENLKAIQDALK